MNQESTARRIFKWFSENHLKGNGDICHVSLSTKEKVITNVDLAQIENSHSKKLVGVIIENKLRFEEHIQTIGKT